MAEGEEELNSLLMQLKKESEKAGLKLNIQKTKIMASGPITSWQIDGETTETVTDFIFLGFKITADGDCSHEIKRCLLPGRKAMTKLDNILKSRDTTLPTMICVVRAMVFPVVMYRYEMWTIKKVECWGIDALELWCWRRLLRVPWIVRRSNQSIPLLLLLFSCSVLSAGQASLSFTNSQSLLKLMSIESVMPSNHLILCHPLLLLPSIFPNIRVFSNESDLYIRWPKYGASASVLLMNIQDWSPLGWTGWISLQSKGLSRVFSSTTVQNHQLFGAQPFL